MYAMFLYPVIFAIKWRRKLFVASSLGMIKKEKGGVVVILTMGSAMCWETWYLMRRLHGGHLIMKLFQILIYSKKGWNLQEFT